MRITLVNPALEMASRSWFPLGIGYIAAVLRERGHQVDIIDIPGENLSRTGFLRRLKQSRAECFGIGGIVTAFNNAVDAALYIRRLHPRARIMAGNTVAYSVPEIILRHSPVEVVVLGEGERTVLDLVDALAAGAPLECVRGICFKNEGGAIVYTEKREPIQDIDSLPFPAWDLLPIANYFRNTASRYCVVSTVRGCPYNCVYCCKTYMGYRIRYRSPESIVAELTRFHEIYNIDRFYFFDDLSTVNKERMLAFCDLKMRGPLAPMKWTISARVSSMDEKLARALKSAGCADVGFGIECYDQTILDSINKKVRLEQVNAALDVCDRVGLSYQGSSFMIGMYGDSEETIRRSAEFARSRGIRYEPHFMTPFPSTPLYEETRERGLIPDELAYLKRLADQGNTNRLLVNVTKSLSDRELTELREKYLYFPPKAPLKKFDLFRAFRSIRTILKQGGVSRLFFFLKSLFFYKTTIEKNSNIWK